MYITASECVGVEQHLRDLEIALKVVVVALDICEIPAYRNTGRSHPFCVCVLLLVLYHRSGCTRMPCSTSLLPGFLKCIAKNNPNLTISHEIATHQLR